MPKKALANFIQQKLGLLWILTAHLAVFIGLRHCNGPWASAIPTFQYFLRKWYGRKEESVIKKFLKEEILRYLSVFFVLLILIFWLIRWSFSTCAAKMACIWQGIFRETCLGASTYFIDWYWVYLPVYRNFLKLSFINVNYLTIILYTLIHISSGKCCYAGVRMRADTMN